jgi:hypothetical protein
MKKITMEAVANNGRICNRYYIEGQIDKTYEGFTGVMRIKDTDKYPIRTVRVEKSKLPLEGCVLAMVQKLVDQN